MKKRVSTENTNINNASAVETIIKNTYERIAHLAWERGYANNIALFMFWGKL